MADQQVADTQHCDTQRLVEQVQSLLEQAHSLFMDAAKEPLATQHSETQRLIGQVESLFDQAYCLIVDAKKDPLTICFITLLNMFFDSKEPRP